jgi:hypothetical protein
MAREKQWAKSVEWNKKREREKKKKSTWHKRAGNERTDLLHDPPKWNPTTLVME